jgi:hypothetical protein
MVLVAAFTLMAGPAAAQSIQAEQPADWTDWATVKVSWAHPSPQEDDWIGAFLVDWPATCKPRAATNQFLKADTRSAAL